ncbi:hypothetical protein OJ996_08415 [Luteolibacter sp. GHJ8]|uniref:Lipoprotein n=1 Tax=Luteolibacter rhizosphaerae TaxID=2989719 RepID=A0ABT3G2Y3_9BACT|nr:hypothetical protein [Luteolibacter rhizosphaerae]MCW1913595.1 hypothetical protein [Luteolibacter rhizosphaerae]
MKFLMNSKGLWFRAGRNISVALLAAFWLTGCASNVSPGSGDVGEARGAYITAPPGSPAKPAASPERARQKAAEERPGLATGKGEQIESPWNRQSFVRASATKPAGMGAIYYNNREGIAAMTGYKEKVDGMQRAAGDMIEWGVKGGFGYLPSYQTYGPSRRFVVGSRDSNYSIVLKNRCKSRLEVVLSVDGLDVIDGNPAGFSKRGYVIGSGETLEVKGWRTSPETVARFNFSTVSGSHANLTHGDHRNVGVIGLAVFTEEGVDPWTWMPREVDQRINADPFARKL